MSNALLALLALLLGIIGWFLRQTYHELRRAIDTVRDQLEVYQHVTRQRHNLVVATLMGLLMELHPTGAAHVRDVMLRLMEGED